MMIGFNKSLEEVVEFWAEYLRRLESLSKSMKYLTKVIKQEK